MKLSLYGPFLSKPELALPFYAATVGNPRYQPPVWRPDGIPHYQLLYTHRGSGECRISGERRVLTAGELYILPPGEAHDYRSVGEVWETMYITVGGLGLNGFFALPTIVLKLPEEFGFETRWRELQRLKFSGNAVGELSVELYRLLVDLSRLAEDASSRAPTRSRFEATVGLIHDDPTRTVSELAALSGLGEEHFCRIFKRRMGCRPLEYITAQRMERAKLLLETTELTVAQIGERVGLRSPSYFVRVFRESCGVTPGEYRQSLR